MTSDRFCTNCGSVVEGQKFCGSCGKSVGAQETAPHAPSVDSNQTETMAPSRAKNSKVLIAITSAVVLLGLSVWIFSSSSSSCALSDSFVSNIQQMWVAGKLTGTTPTFFITQADQIRQNPSCFDTDLVAHILVNY